MTAQPRASVGVVRDASDQPRARATREDMAWGEAGDEGKGKKSLVRKWSEEEDQLMLLLVKTHGTRQWGLIGSLLSGRTGKQCRER
jgi:Myb-like DNA-binding domain